MRPEEREDKLHKAGKINHIELEEQIMFSFLPKNRKLKILDVGCGVGNIAQEVIKKGHDVIGIDFSKVAIANAKKRGLKAKVVDVDGQGLPFPDKSFDGVWMGDIIEHVFDPINLLKEANRVLKKGGMLFLTTPNNFSIIARLRILITGRAPQESVYRNLGISKHHTYFSWSLLKYMLKVSKFKILLFRAIFPVPMLRVNKALKSSFLGNYLSITFVLKLLKK